jgi:hypothetical protein
MGTFLGGLLSIFAGFNLAVLIVEGVPSVQLREENALHAIIIIIIGFILCLRIGFSLISVAQQPLKSGIYAFFICWAEVSWTRFSRSDSSMSILAGSTSDISL